MVAEEATMQKWASRAVRLLSLDQTDVDGRRGSTITRRGLRATDADYARARW